MKRYDEFAYVECIKTHVKTDASPRNYTYEGLKARIDDPEFLVRVRCRKCNNHHDISVQCQVCGLTTKVNYKDYED